MEIFGFAREMSGQTAQLVGQAEAQRQEAKQREEAQRAEAIRREEIFGPGADDGQNES